MGLNSVKVELWIVSIIGGLHCCTLYTEARIIKWQSVAYFNKVCMPCFEYTEGYMGEYFIPLAHYLRLSLAVHTHCSRSQYTPTALARSTHPLLSLAVHTHCSRSQYRPVCQYAASTR